jgi:hypothetical protein
MRAWRPSYIGDGESKHGHENAGFSTVSSSWPVEFYSENSNPVCRRAIGLAQPLSFSLLGNSRCKEVSCIYSDFSLDK